MVQIEIEIGGERRRSKISRVYTIRPFLNPFLKLTAENRRGQFSCARCKGDVCQFDRDGVFG